MKSTSPPTATARPVQSAERQRIRRPHATGLTMLFVVLLAVGLSVAPEGVPDWARPFPSLRQRPEDTVLSAVLPRWKRDVPAAPVAAPVLVQAAPRPWESAQSKAHPLTVEVPRPEALTARAIEALPAEDRVRADELERLVKQMGARHMDVEQGCRKMGPEGCERWALDAFFDALEDQKLGFRDDAVRVVHLGDSLIASDYITGLIRDRLQARHGSGGSGFFFVDRPTRNAGLATRTGTATEGWGIVRLTDPERPSVLGLTGVAFATEESPETASFDARRARLADIMYLRQPGGGELEVRSDDKLLAKVSTRETGISSDVVRLALPDKTKRLSVTARGRVQLYGVALEGVGPGVVYDSIGLPGATADVFLRADHHVFSQQLSARDPSLVVLMLGGNEAFELARGRAKPQDTVETMGKLIQRIQDAAPDAACLLISPMAAGIRTMSGELQPRAGTRPITEAVRTAALKNGCAFWDMHAAMGGDGVLQAWLDKGLLLDDLVHPRSLGADMLGHLFDLSLARTLLVRQTQPLEPLPVVRGQTLERQRLDRVLRKLVAVETGQRDRVAAVQLGASHTAAHFFTDQVRRRLSAKFGDAGRGFVAAGKASKRLEPSGVRRSLSGSWEVSDARKPDADRLWALTGIRAVGQPSSRLDFTFCARCTDTEVSSRLQFFYVEEATRGAMELRLDGKAVATPVPSDGGTRQVKVLSFEAPGGMHRLEVRNKGPGTLTVLGAASELDRKGVVYDAIGLPGSTIFTLAGYDRDALVTQLKARAPDLFVLFYGTNESALPGIDEESMRSAYSQVFVALKAAAPEADCLLLGPTDRMSQQPDLAWQEASSERGVVTALRSIAAEHGCAFWSAQTAMGGPGSVHTWLKHAPRLAHPDHVHLTPRGYAALADAFVDDVLAAYGEVALAPAPTPAAPDASVPEAP